MWGAYMTWEFISNDERAEYLLIGNHWAVSWLKGEHQPNVPTILLIQEWSYNPNPIVNSHSGSNRQTMECK
jgi:hypothetical protein